MSEGHQPVLQVTEELVLRLTISRLSVQITELQEMCILYQRKVAELEAKVKSLTDVSEEKEV